eukprot:CAMPEP_0196591908 /NCGR_PEP_ID=MMETSP1081-20130531/71270_1 /TAXON_ID=36882 /ORGANISM="Pyramimonas amylifera, Strain CCMP720" /LENGTH=376 /DNA_ID=CAMNT_0041915435 /DNA_START=52 /DNA_END=1179 /DNA_ORIENTATION=+
MYSNKRSRVDPTQLTPGRAVYISKLPPNTTIGDVLDLASKYGRIDNVALNQQKGSAFVNFIDDSYARQMYDDVQSSGLFLNDQQLIFGWARAKAMSQELQTAIEKGATRCLYLGSLTPDISEQELLMLGLTDVASIKMFPEKGFAFVTFFNLETAVKAHAALEGSGIRGRPVKVNFAKEVTGQASKGSSSVSNGSFAQQQIYGGDTMGGHMGGQMGGMSSQISQMGGQMSNPMGGQMGAGGMGSQVGGYGGGDGSMYGGMASNQIGGQTGYYGYTQDTTQVPTGYSQASMLDSSGGAGAMGSFQAGSGGMSQLQAGDMLGGMQGSRSGGNSSAGMGMMGGQGMGMGGSNGYGYQQQSGMMMGGGMGNMGGGMGGMG